MLINIIITTYQREGMLKSLVNKLQGDNVYFTIINDGSPYYYFTAPENCTYIQLDRNHGKKEYWKVVNHAFENRVDADYYIMLPDDAGVDSDFVSKAVESWNKVSFTDRACLNLLVDQGRKGKPCWTGIKPVKEMHSGLLLWWTQWVDMCFISDKVFFDEIPSLTPIHIPDDQLKYRGSGVGAQISKRLHKNGYNLYQLDETLVHHGTHESKLNHELRDENPLIA